MNFAMEAEEGIFLFAKSTSKICLAEEGTDNIVYRFANLKRKQQKDNVFKKYPIQIITYDTLLKEQYNIRTITSYQDFILANGTQLAEKKRRRMNRTRRFRRERKLKKL
jgi:hypothetical protein